MEESHETSERPRGNDAGPPASGSGKGSSRKWWMIGIAVLCIAVAILWEARSLSRKAGKTDPNEAAAGSEKPRGHSPVTVIVDANTAALKDEQLKLAERLIKKFPKNETPLVVMGDILRGHGNAIEARKFYARALKINPMRADVYITLSELSSKEGKFAESITHLQRVLNMQPKAPGIHGRIGETLMKLGKIPEAIASLERELQIAQSANCHFMIGQSHLMQKEHEKARENYEAAVKLDPGFAKAYYGLVSVEAKLGNYDKAKEHSEVYRKLKAEARKELIAGRNPESDIIQVRKNSAVTHIKAGQMYRKDGKLQIAREMLEKAAQLDPENVGGLLELAFLYQQTNQRFKLHEIQAQIRGSQMKTLNNCIIFGKLCWDLEMIDDAEAAYSKAIAVAPRKPLGYRKLAQFYLETKKQMPKARQLAEKAVELEGSAFNYFLLGLARVGNGDKAGAVQAVKRAVELEPGNVEYQRYYNMIRK